MNERREELEQKITELEESLAHLKEKLRAENEAEQHRAIDGLEDYFLEVDNRFANLSDFWGIVIEEFRALFQDKEEQR